MYQYANNGFLESEKKHITLKIVHYGHSHFSTSAPLLSIALGTNWVCTRKWKLRKAVLCVFAHQTLDLFGNIFDPRWQHQYFQHASQNAMIIIHIDFL